MRTISKAKRPRGGKAAVVAPRAKSRARLARADSPARALADSPARLTAQAQRLLRVIGVLSRNVALRDPLGTYISELDLTPPQIHTIMGLGHGGRARMSDLARRMCVDGATMTGVIDRLERAALVRRQRDTEDRRVVFLSLTRAGEVAFGKVERALGERLGQIISLLDGVDRERLIDIMERLAAKVAAAAPSRRR